MTTNRKRLWKCKGVYLLLGQRKLNIYHKEKLDVKASKSAAGIKEVIKEALNNKNLKKNAEKNDRE